MTQVRTFPHKKALTTRDGYVTFEDLLLKVREDAAYIQDLALEANEPVALGFPNGVQYISLILACELTGHPSVLFGSGMKSSELSFHIDKLGLRYFISSKKLDAQLRKTASAPVGLGRPDVTVWRFSPSTKALEFENGDFICQLTSGTGGIPKAVVRTSEAVWREIRDVASTLGLSENDVVLTIPPIHHSYGLVGGTLTPLCYGASTILLDGFVPSETISAVESEKVSILFAVPFMYDIVNKSLSHRPADFSSIRLCLSAGAPISSAVVSDFKRYTNRQISQDYGSTEAGTMCLSIREVRSENDVGLPLTNHQICILGEDGGPVRQGQTGGIYIKSEATARCYLYPTELNQVAFRGPWFGTGDRGYVDEGGRLHVIGRSSFLINVTGNKVDPAEVEGVISRIRGVEDVAVVGIPSVKYGQKVKAVIAASTTLDRMEIIRYCKLHLSNFKTPSVIQFVKELPKSTTGKILKKELIDKGEG